MSKLPAIFRPAPGSGAERAEQLRRQYPRFVYERFALDRSADTLRVTFHFRIEPDIVFAPETTFSGVDWPRVDSLPQGALENLLFHLGLIETLSYWKATCSPEIRVEVGQLDPQQITWFLDLLRHGMGEFFYVNQIDWRAPEFVRVVASGDARMKSEVQVLRFAQDDKKGNAVGENRRDLVLTSGGKDSVVTLELLRATLSATGRPFDCLLLNPTEAALAVAGRALLHQGSGGRAIRSSKNVGGPIIVRRTIDPRLLELNAAGYLNGHTPFSALLAVLGVTAAAIYGYNRVIVSNERSAEEAGVEYLGEQINHQYSKTLRFETAFREYSRKYLAPPRWCHPDPGVPGEGSALLENTQDDNEGFEYFSLLRSLYELQIARLFAQHSAYFLLFRSCNRGMKSNAWCGRCSKCLFVYTALYPFLEREQMLAIFGSDLFAWEGAAEVLRTLLGLDAHKPFECVGTRDETLAAIYLCAEKIKGQGIPLPASLREIEETILATRRDLPELARSILTAWSDQHHLPLDLAELLRQKIIR
ncbi:MAG: hypothetical protein A3H28_11175 [Acidobacteria bacterium RIFCSPLOWO2_02_FULL_61_28]|nr:MAG: hypothetical protein A3H28_11175 [Acidobacteria bacterium RIFCSPLOWO2_02_FULL_61_28]